MTVLFVWIKTDTRYSFLTHGGSYSFSVTRNPLWIIQKTLPRWTTSSKQTLPGNGVTHGKLLWRDAMDTCAYIQGQRRGERNPAAKSPHPAQTVVEFSWHLSLDENLNQLSLELPFVQTQPCNYLSSEAASLGNWRIGEMWMRSLQDEEKMPKEVVKIPRIIEACPLEVLTVSPALLDNGKHLVMNISLHVSPTASLVRLFHIFSWPHAMHLTPCTLHLTGSR